MFKSIEKEENFNTIFHTAMAEKLLTGSYVAGNIVNTLRFNFCLVAIDFTIGTGGTGWEVQVERTADKSTYHIDGTTHTNTIDGYFVCGTHGLDFMRFSIKQNGAPGVFGTALIKVRGIIIPAWLYTSIL